MARRPASIIGLTLLLVAFTQTRNHAAQQPPPRSTQLPAAASEASSASYDTPPAIRQVDGGARLLRQGQSQAAVANMPLIEGDRITTQAGRVAVMFPDGSLLHIDRNTSIDFLSMSLVRLHDGRVILVTAGRDDRRSSVDYQVDAAAGSVRVQSAGEYKVALQPHEVELDVVSGTAALATDQGSVQVEAGERAFAREGQAPSEPQAFNSARLDEFDQWSESQRDAQVGAESAQYLPADLRQYAGTFDQNGRWENNASYGYVWYPTVSVGWRPYYNGYWDSVGPYGWTWIGYDPWCWPTQHFGYWGFNAGLWFWIPGRHWGPAWVSWAYSPGYYGWCPLGYGGHAVVGFGHYGHYDPWHCWTVVHRGHFGHGYGVPHYAVAGGHLTATERNGFVVGRGPATGVAVARQGGTPGGGGHAVARALPGVSMSARPRESMFREASAVPRGMSSATVRGSQRAGVTATAPRYDTRSLPYTAAPRSNSFSAGTAAPRSNTFSPGSAAPRDSARAVTPYSNRTTPSYRAVPRGSDRPPSSYSTQPRGGYQAPTYHYGTSPQSAAPRGSAPSLRYSAPSSRPYQGPPTHYGTPPQTASPRYSAPPRSSAPAAPRYSAPSYSAPASPRGSAPSYSAPASPRYSAPSYSAPRGPSGGGAMPRSGGAAAPHGNSSGSARPAPRSGGGRGR